MMISDVWTSTRWVECIVTESTYFSLNSDTCPIHLALLDEVVANHPLLHAKVLALFTSLFENTYGESSFIKKKQDFKSNNCDTNHQNKCPLFQL